MNFELACLEDFNEIENLYWDLIDKSKEEPSFPDWKKGTSFSRFFNGWYCSERVVRIKRCAI